jgi:hypothetical protein
MGLQRRITVALPHWSAAVELLPDTDLVLTIARRAVGPLRAFRQLRYFAPLQLPKLAYQQAWHIRKDTDPAWPGCGRWWRTAAPRACHLAEGQARQRCAADGQPMAHHRAPWATCMARPRRGPASPLPSVHHPVLARLAGGLDKGGSRRRVCQSAAPPGRWTGGGGFNGR